MNNKNEPLVYIILVNYKGVNHTIECIKSLKKIIYKNYKIIVVDNNSKDNSINELSKIKDIVLIKNKINAGFAGGNNLGIKFAIDNGADYVLLLNNDTTVEIDFLNQLIDEAEKDVGIYVGKIMFYYDKNIIWYAGGKIDKFRGCTNVNGFVEDKGQFEKESFVTFATGCCMLIERDVIKKVGLLKEDYFLYFEDTDYCARTLKQGYKIKYCPKAIIYHKESVSTKKHSFNFDYYFTRNRLFFIKDNLKGFYKIISYCYTNVFIFAKAIMKKQSLRATIYSYKHFFINRRGSI